tara:strand:- start:43144 stop:44223 length:1080 start_codon:yes stop_codon:yes gene_type:complete
MDPCNLFDGLNIHEDDPIDIRLQQEALKNSIPLNVSFELTQSCNFSCQHCYNFDRTVSTKPQQQESILTKEEILQTLKDLKGMGAFFLCFTGGEVLLAPNLELYISEAKKLGFSIRLKSNASLLTLEKAKKLKSLGVDDIEFSLYGATTDTYQEFTGSHYKIEEVVEGIRNATKAKIALEVNIILHRKNYKEYDQMIKICEQLNVHYQVSIDMTVRHDGSKGSIDHRLTIEELEDFFTTEQGRKAIPDANTSGNLQCACARSNCGIGINGEVYPCIGAPIPAGNLKNNSFQEIWNKSPVLNNIRGLNSEDFKDCHKCEVKEYCARSSGLIYLNTGKYTGKEEYSCERAYLTKKLLSQKD